MTILKIIALLRLPPFFIEIYENVSFNKMYIFFLNEQILSLDQSGFLTSDSCANQLLSITQILNAKR